jgi:hypothetical protein
MTETASTKLELVEPVRLLRRPKTGGRRAGTPNKKTVERRLAIENIKASGKDPVSFFADLLRNEAAPLDLRFAAAKELAPFVHPRLASVEARTGVQSHEDRLAAAHALLADMEADSQTG